jgi:hypothetical protein
MVSHNFPEKKASAFTAEGRAADAGHPDGDPIPCIAFEDPLRR